MTAPKGALTLKAEVHWSGGEVTPVEVTRGRKGVTRYVADPELVELVRELAAEFSDAQIARILNRKRLRTAKGLVFTAHRVSNLRHTHGVESGTKGRKLQGEDVYTAQEAARLLGVDRSTVTRWVEAGLLHGSQMTEGAPWRVRVTEEDQRKMRAADCPDGWLPLKGAAYVLGVSQQTVLDRLKAGGLEAVRVHVGRRSAWRVHISKPAQPKNNQQSLYDPSTS